MYTEGFQQWFKLNKHLNTPLTDWNKTISGIYQHLTECQMELLSNNFSRLSDQLKNFSDIKKPEEYLHFQKEMINENITTAIDNMHTLLQESMLQLEELMKLFTAFNETAVIPSANKHAHGKSTEKERTGN